MGKKTDKMYITASEWENEFGGAKKLKINNEFKKLPFSCCSLTFTPFEHPVCTPEGIIFDLLHIVPWLKKHGTNPITGEPLDGKSLIKLHWSKNNQGHYQCPITFKEFNDHTHIVAIGTSGNVYAYEAVDQLNIKTKNWKDLLTDEKFTRKDIITLQDPHNMRFRNMLDFHFVKNRLAVDKLDHPESEKETTNTVNINANKSTSRILQEMAEKEKKQDEDVTKSFVKKDKKTYNTAHYSTGMSAYSLTSMSFTPATKIIAATISDEQYLFQNINEKALLQIKTNFGDMNFELYCKECPRTCYNMIMLAKQGRYDNSIFHRSIRGFMVQGGDFTNKDGSGGESYWSKPFKDEFHHSLQHKGRGMLAMANRGPNSNTSQFYITYQTCGHLNNKHTVFGKMIGGDSTLDAIENVQTIEGDRPVQPIRILEISVVSDPYEALLNKDKIIEETIQSKKEQRERKQRLVQLSQGTVQATDEIGKYLKKRPHSATTNVSSMIPEDAPAPLKKQTKKGFGSFDNW